MNLRFELVDRRFEGLDQRFELLEHKVLAAFRAELLTAMGAQSQVIAGQTKTLLMANLGRSFPWPPSSSPPPS